MAKFSIIAYQKQVLFYETSQCQIFRVKIRGYIYEFPTFLATCKRTLKWLLKLHITVAPGENFSVLRQSQGVSVAAFAGRDLADRSVDANISRSHLITRIAETQPAVTSFATG